MFDGPALKLLIGLPSGVSHFGAALEKIGRALAPIYQAQLPSYKKNREIINWPIPGCRTFSDRS